MSNGFANRRPITLVATAGVLSLWLACIAGSSGQDLRPSSSSPDHSAIGYGARLTHDPVAALNTSLAAGKSVLAVDGRSGYLPAVLDALAVPAESQLLVFSKTGVQAGRTGPGNPRALFFNDSVIVGYIRDAPFLEVAAQDAQQGVTFYTFDQNRQDRPLFTRQDRCLGCHLSLNTLDVPGVLDRSQFTGPGGANLRQLGQYLVDHRTPLAHRWGGYYVTGASASVQHMGNQAVRPGAEAVTSGGDVVTQPLPAPNDMESYPTPSSDVAALLVFDHQMRMMNLLTRLGWEVRVAQAEHRLDLSHGVQRDAVDEIVDYMLFVDEAPLDGVVAQSSAYVIKFGQQGPWDRRHRSLRDLDLKQRLMRYPCSYMIYSAVFDGLPSEAKRAVYERLWSILSGREKGARYSRLTAADRTAIVEILRDTKTDLPREFAVSPAM